MAFRRGFKSACERRAVEIRKSLSLGPTGPLSAEKLAASLGVVVWSVEDVEELSVKARATLVDEDDDSWSALAMQRDNRWLIIYKPVTSLGRRNSVIMHELAHIMLGHALSQAMIAPEGSLAAGNFDQDQEDEANWLAGVLLLPRPALVAIKRQGLSDDEACERYCVSAQMLTWRTRMTGVDRQMNAAANYAAR